MSELANKLKQFRADKSQQEVSEKAGISKRTYCRAEAGEPVRFDTLRGIANALDLSTEDRIALWLTWFKTEIPEDFARLKFSFRDKPLKTTEVNSIMDSLLQKIEQLPLKDQKELLKAVDRPEVLDVIKNFNELYDSIKKSVKPEPQRYPSHRTSSVSLNDEANS